MMTPALLGRNRGVVAALKTLGETISLGRGLLPYGFGKGRACGSSISRLGVEKSMKVLFTGPMELCFC